MGVDALDFLGLFAFFTGGHTKDDVPDYHI